MPTDPAEPRPVAYEPPQGGVTRRSFRLLLVLTAANTILLGTYILGPGLTTFVRQQYAEYQQRQADKKVEAQKAIVRRSFMPAQQQCMDYLAPAGTLLYTEDPSEGSLIEAAGPVNHVCSVSWTNRPSALQFVPIGATNPPFLTSMPSAITEASNLAGSVAVFSPSSTLLYLHRCQTPAGTRLVAVLMSSRQGIKARSEGPDRVANGFLSTDRTLTGYVLCPITVANDMSVLNMGSTEISQGQSLFTMMPRDEKPDLITIDYSGFLSLYAGQPDATDPARFHIPYTFDDHHGTIDGVLSADDHLKLTPDAFLADSEARESEHPFVVPSPDVRRATGKPR